MRISRRAEITRRKRFFSSCPYCKTYHLADNGQVGVVFRPATRNLGGRALVQDSFTEDVVALLPNLKRFALSLCRRGDIADDLVQITAERAFRARDRFDPATRLEAWLFRILRNAWIDMIRRDKTRGELVDIHESPQPDPVDSAAQADDRLMVQVVQAAMTRLPEDQRIVLHLVCVEGLSYAETAATLDIPPGTVMSRLSRARAALVKVMGIKGPISR
ncbi:MAG: RNA polymerase subunit sigma-70 [Rhodobacteraceae bacterium CG17_big_fil_post_rev_8_21_14_2_50_63_15]|nr:RNA polymerase sigma factor [Roseovarius sp.]PIV79340.1 MAG: RNA polymerase subunit sigma-70 [Rhodobacteraceae bacterium CG17_big_fil_post_rev_8_21_14_2_50_63_15]